MKSISELRPLCTVTIAHDEEYGTYFLKNGYVVTEIDRRTAESILATALVQQEQILDNNKRTVELMQRKYDNLRNRIYPAKAA
jgi:hypothetical protein